MVRNSIDGRIYICFPIYGIVLSEIGVGKRYTQQKIGNRIKTEIYSYHETNGQIAT